MMQRWELPAFGRIHTPELLCARSAQLFDWITEGKLRVGERVAYGDGAFTLLRLEESLRDIGKIPLEREPVTQADYKDPSPMLRNAKIGSYDRNDGGPRVSSFTESLEDLGSEMAILHGHHVGDVLHHEGAWPEKPHDADEFLVEAVARVVEIARPDLAEPLAGRSTVDNVDLEGDKLVEARHARLRILQEAGNVALKESNFIEIGGMREARLSIRFNSADDIPACKPYSLAKASRTAEEGHRSESHDCQLG
jgi:hypothetical protein